MLVINSLLTSRNAARLALRVREIDRRDGRRRNYEESCHQFLIAARQLRLPIDGTAAEETGAALSELRRAVAGIELYGPAGIHDVAAAALEAIESLVRTRSDGAWTESIIDAESACDKAMAAARAGLANSFTAEGL